MSGQRRGARLALSLAALLLVAGAACYPYRQLLAEDAADPAGADPADQPLYSLLRSWLRWGCCWRKRTQMDSMMAQEAAARDQRRANLR